MTIRPQQTHGERIRDALQFAPTGFRDDDGVWWDGPIQSDALAELDALLARLEQAERERDELEAVAREYWLAYHDEHCNRPSWPDGPEGGIHEGCFYPPPAVLGGPPQEP